MGRRGHGEGSIYQRKGDGRWCAELERELADGTQKKQYIYGKSRKEVIAKLQAAQREKQVGQPLANERQTVEQFLERWLVDVITPRARPKTIESYRQIATLHIIPTLGNVQLAKLTPQQVQRLLSQKSAAGLSPRTVAYIRGVLSMALEQALKWSLVGRNVARLVSVPRGERAEMTFLTLEQSKQLLEAARGDRLEALYRLALSLGLRRGEVLGLRWSDIDFDQRTLRIASAVIVVNNKVMVTTPKTATSRRTLPLPVFLVAPLELQRERQEIDRQTAGERWQEQGLVFTSAIGTPIHPRNLLRAFHVLLKRAGLPQMRFHDLRHSCASLLAAQGVPARVAMEILGHTDIRITQNIYTHVFDESKRQAANVMDRLLGDPEEG